MEKVTMHRHVTQWVDHSEADHNHGVCSTHAHWAGGSHPLATPLEESTSETDPLGWDAATYKRVEYTRE